MERCLDAPLSQWLIHGDLPCLRCQYNLRGLVGPLVACPECGRSHDLRNPAPWSTIALPLGVRQRQHWPASSAGLSVLLAPEFFFVYLSWRVGQQGLFLLFLAALLATAYAWIRSVGRWHTSCISRKWAILVLLVLHASTWMLILSLIWILVMDSYLLPVTMIWPTPVLVVLGLSGFAWTAFAVRDAGADVHFREDWQQWRIPVGKADGCDTAPSTTAEPTEI